jgi:hypothetical protein
MPRGPLYSGVFLRALPVAVLLLPIYAQEPTPGLLRGEILAWTGNTEAGEIVVRTEGYAVFQCSFDRRSYFERDNENIAAGEMLRGDAVEIATDRRLGTGILYARVIHILASRRPRPQPATVRARFRIPALASSSLDSFAPRGNLTLAGVVLQVRADVLVLELRSREHKTIRLGANTRYFTAGQIATREDLSVNTRVFIRAAKNLEDEIEAYQIIWGDIVVP